MWIGLLGAASLTGLFFGAIATGPIADGIGRRGIFAWDMLIFAVLSTIQFFIQSPWQLLMLRLLIGLVLGADYVVTKHRLFLTGGAGRYTLPIHPTDTPPPSRSASKPGGDRRMCSSRKPIGPVRKPRSISAT